MRDIPFALLALSAMIAAAPVAQGQDRTIRKLKPGDFQSQAVKPHVNVPGLRIASFPDGGYIETINGNHWVPVMHPGMKLTIKGAGFLPRQSRSLLGLFDGAGTTGIQLSVIAWSDTTIEAVIPIDETALTHSTNSGRLSIQPVTSGGVQRRYELQGIRFIAAH